MAKKRFANPSRTAGRHGVMTAETTFDISPVSVYFFTAICVEIPNRAWCRSGHAGTVVAKPDRWSGCLYSTG